MTNACIVTASLNLDGDHRPRVLLALKTRDGVATVVSDPVDEGHFLRDLLALLGPFEGIKGRNVRAVMDGEQIVGLADIVEDVAIRLRDPPAQEDPAEDE